LTRQTCGFRARHEEPCFAIRRSEQHEGSSKRGAKRNREKSEERGALTALLCSIAVEFCRRTVEATSHANIKGLAKGSLAEMRLLCKRPLSRGYFGPSHHCEDTAARTQVRKQRQIRTTSNPGGVCVAMCLRSLRMGACPLASLSESDSFLKAQVSHGIPAFRSPRTGKAFGSWPLFSSFSCQRDNVSQY